MELIQFTAPIIFYIKIFFIFLMFIINIYLIITYKKEESLNTTRILQSGFNIKNLRSVLGNLVSIGGFLSIYITIKNELKSVQIGKIDQLIEAERVEIRKSIDKDKEEHQKILNSLEENREELFKLQLDKTKLLGHNDRLLTLHNNLKNNVISYQQKSVDPSTKLSELGILDQLIKQDTNKFGQELNSLILAIENSYNIGAGADTSISSTSNTKLEAGGIDSLNEIKESITVFPFFNLDVFSKGAIECFDNLIVIKKIAVCLIIGKSVIFSSLISIIFVFYGNILIEKYDLENKYPKLATIIKLRRKFQKYYFNYYCGLIFIAILTEIIFGVAVLLL